MTNYQIRLQYIGTRYSGWQIQKDRQTIQGCIIKTLHQITGETASIIGAGRTDSGVHAMGQVAHFKLSKMIPTTKLKSSLNGILPWDIRIQQVKHVHANFHAQKDAFKKRYEYRIYNGRILSPFLHGYVHHTRARLNLEAMQQSMQYLKGSQDFSSFAATATQVKNRTRTIFLSQIINRGNHIRYQVEANGFLYHMVRNIVGTLVMAGQGKILPDYVPTILAARNRSTAGPCAPPDGLYLTTVEYD